MLPRKPSLEAPQATAGPGGVCLLTELQALPSPPLSPILPKHAHGQRILPFLPAHKLFLLRWFFFPLWLLKSSLSILHHVPFKNQKGTYTFPPLLSNLHSSRKKGTQSFLAFHHSCCVPWHYAHTRISWPPLVPIAQRQSGGLQKIRTQRCCSLSAHLCLWVSTRTPECQ